MEILDSAERIDTMAMNYGYGAAIAIPVDNSIKNNGYAVMNKIPTSLKRMAIIKIIDKHMAK